MSEYIVRVVSDYFVAGLTMRDDICVQAAPILRLACINRTRDDLRDLFAKMGWKASIIPPCKTPPLAQREPSVIPQKQ